MFLEQYIAYKIKFIVRECRINDHGYKIIVITKYILFSVSKKIVLIYKKLNWLLWLFHYKLYKEDSKYI